MTNRILVVEDEPSIAMLISRVLTASGFGVTHAATGEKALRTARTADYDLIILDLLLPDMRGERVLAEVMTFRPGSRVLVLSSVTHIATRVAVLDDGAVDFLAKPFANDELVARVRARIRAEHSAPASPAAPARYLRAAGMKIDLVQREVVANGRRVELTHREFVLLTYLLQHAPNICSRSDILQGVWGTTFDGRTNVVDVCVNRLRCKLQDQKIETIRNSGYRLVTN